VWWVSGGYCLFKPAAEWRNALLMSGARWCWAPGAGGARRLSGV
jgi:hypothetical protein